jgi:1,4-alpha-glucan branching enzyme
MTATVRQNQANQTVFSLCASHATSVFLAGTFNGWNPRATPMRKYGDCEWRAALELPPGRYEYKFVVDGQWCCRRDCHDRAYPGPGCVTNEYGTFNLVIEVE